MHTITRIFTRFLCILSAASPLMMLIIRLWMARIFWLSGILKISNWDATIALFTSEHPVPYLPVVVAAIFATTFELLCPILLTIGLASRLAAIPLLIMTAVINFTYQHAIEHYYWAMLLGMILFYGPGKWSLDYVIGKRLLQRDYCLQR